MATWMKRCLELGGWEDTDARILSICLLYRVSTHQAGHAQEQGTAQRRKLKPWHILYVKDLLFPWPCGVRGGAP